MAADGDRLLKSVGRRFAELRIQRRLTQAQLAERLGVSVPYVASVEAGNENLTLRSLAKLAKLLGTRPVELLRAPRTRKARKPGRPPAR